MIAAHLWQSTLFAALAGLLTLALRHNRARIRYCVWLAASLKFLVPFSLLVDLGGLFPRHTTGALVPTALPVFIEQTARPFVAPVPLPPHPSPASWIPALLAMLWAAGFLALSVSWWLRWRALCAAVRTASPLDMPVPMRVRTSPAFAEPGVFGIVRPILLLPEGIAACLTAPELRAILAHEQCHARRHDNLSTALHMAVEALFWFHPLVWWLGARLIEERERACDEEVLAQGADPEVYAGGILKICELYLESPLPCVSGVTGANLTKRIEAIMSNRAALRLTLARKALLAAVAAATLAVPIAIGILNAPAIEAQSPSSSSGARFEVASIKPCPNGAASGLVGKRGGSGGGPVRWSPGRLDEECQTVADLIRDAYLRYPDGKPWTVGVAGTASTSQPENFQCIGCGGGRGGIPPVSYRIFRQPLEGAPGWTNAERYTIDAKAEGPERQEMMRGPMLQALLEDRCKLKLHRESKDVPVYQLIVAKGGARLAPHREGSCMPLGDFGKPESRRTPGGQFCGLLGQDILGTTMANLCSRLSDFADRDVIDKTGMTGLFDLRFDLQPLAPPAGEAAVPTRPPTPSEMAVYQSERFTQYQAALAQLGLKLEPAKGPGIYLVIDHIERPTGN